MSLTYTVYCAILGESKPFQVVVNSNQTVLDLAHAIKAMREDKLASIQPQDLTMYKVDLIANRDSYKGVMDTIHERSVKLKEKEKLEFLLGTLQELENGFPAKVLHIVVLPPTGGSINSRVCGAVTEAMLLTAAGRELVGSFVKNTFICQRRDTVEALWKLIQNNGVVLICGTPCSGKSTLGWLMIKYAQEVMSRKAAYISEWNRGKSTKKNLFDACKHLPGVTDAPEPVDVPGCGVFFVLDEAQITYSVNDLWNTHLKSCCKTQAPTQFLILACYGSNSKRKDKYATATPISIGPDQRVFLRAPSIPNYPPISLFFDLHELADTVRQHELESKTPYHLSNAAIKDLLKISHGHVGLVKSILDVTYAEFDAEWRDMEIAQRPFITEISSEAFIRETSDTLALLKGVRKRILSRSLANPGPEDSLLKPGVRDLFSRILLQGPVVYNVSDSNHRTVYMRGICQGQVERVRYHRGHLYENFSIVNSSDGDSWFSQGDIVEEVQTLLVFPTMIHAL
jgi:hypothetical protein